MINALRALGVLLGIAGIVLLVVAVTYAIFWLVGVAFNYVPLVGRRYRDHTPQLREPVDTESSKISRR